MGFGDSSQLLVPVRQYLTDKASCLGPLSSLHTLETWFYGHMLGSCSETVSDFVLYRGVSLTWKPLYASWIFVLTSDQCQGSAALLLMQLLVHVLGLAASFCAGWPPRVSLTVFVSVSSCFINMPLKRKCKPGPWLDISLGAVYPDSQFSRLALVLRWGFLHLPACKAQEAAGSFMELTRVLKQKCGRTRALLF